MAKGTKEVIDWSKVDEQLEAGATGTEIAAQLGVHEDTLYRHVQREKGVAFAAYRAQKRAKGDSALRLAQHKCALDGNTTMLIWLGKQRLEQSNDPKPADSFNGSLVQIVEYLRSLDNDNDQVS